MQVIFHHFTPLSYPGFKFPFVYSITPVSCLKKLYSSCDIVLIYLILEILIKNSLLSCFLWIARVLLSLVTS